MKQPAGENLTPRGTSRSGDVLIYWVLVLQTIETAAVTAGVVFGLVQLKQLRKQRESQAGIELLRTLQTPGNAEATMRIYDLPDDLEGSEFVKRLGKNFGPALGVLDMFESLGPLVARGHVPIAMYSEFYRGITVACWNKSRRYILEQRANEWPNFYEWLQWLAERMDEQKALATDIPAYERFKGWKSSADFKRLQGSYAAKSPHLNAPPIRDL